MATAAVRTTARGGNRGVTATAALSITAALVLSGCGSSAKPSDQPASTPTASASSTDPNAAAKADVLTAYRGMWNAQVQAYAKGTLDGTNLQQYAGDKALAGIRATEVYFQDNQIVVHGEPKLSPKVTRIDLDAQPHSATITDCVDSSQWVAVYKANGKPVDTADTNRRHIYTSSARVFEGKWTIMTSTIDRHSTC